MDPEYSLIALVIFLSFLFSNAKKECFKIISFKHSDIIVDMFSFNGNKVRLFHKN